MSNFQVAAVFSNNCVLQRNKDISVFGWCNEEKISLSGKLLDSKGNILGESSCTATSEKWIITFPPQQAAENCTLEIWNETGKAVFTNVAIGEVWLAGGQSNMEFELQNSTEGPAALADENAGKNLRFYYTNKIGWKDDAFYEAEKNTCWQTWDSEWKKSWSAVGFFFGSKLAADLDCVVGVIGCNWGGTSASAWMRKEYLENDEELRTYLTEQEEATKGKSIEQQLKEYDDYTVENDEWQKKCNELYATVPGITWNQIQEKLGTCPWPGPRSCKNPYRPCGLYDCMLSRILPYTLKGVIWYQGESDDHKPQMYAKLFTRMIENWRTDWKDSELPFVFVQLPGNRYEQDKDFKHWCLVREAQEEVHRTVKNAYMTCALELGEFNDIHPKFKKVLGERMEAVALEKVYGQQSGQKTAISPLFESATIEDGRIIVSFSNAPQSFVFKKDEIKMANYVKVEKNQGNTVPADFSGFEIAGEDGFFVNAKAETVDDNKIAIWADDVTSPVSARYAWYNYGPITVYTDTGLPLAPFRTTKKAPEKLEHAEIQQIMTV